jgi:hypothetical protein
MKLSVKEVQHEQLPQNYYKGQQKTIEIFEFF